MLELDNVRLADLRRQSFGNELKAHFRRRFAYLASEPGLRRYIGEPLLRRMRIIIAGEKTRTLSLKNS